MCLQKFRHKHEKEENKCKFKHHLPGYSSHPSSTCQELGQPWPRSPVPIDLFAPSAPPRSEEIRIEASTSKVHGVIDDALRDALGVMAVNQLTKALIRSVSVFDELEILTLVRGSTRFEISHSG